MSAKTQPVHVPREVIPTIKENAKAKNITIGESVADLVNYAVNRKAALAKYEKAKKSE